MTYRGRGEAELERRRALDAAIAAEPDVDRREAIARELARLDGARRADARRRLPVLAQAPRASPCLEPFEAMRGDDAVRTCTRCDREVFDTARMTIGQTEALVAARGPSACTSLRRRSDGTAMFEDCAVGAAGVWTRRAGALVATVAIVGAGLALVTMPPPRIRTVPTRSITPHVAPNASVHFVHERGAWRPSDDMVPFSYFQLPEAPRRVPSGS